MKDKYLKVLSASAGSGKTYNLVQEFLKLTIGNQQRGAFSSIVAMTFTNKASFEMKERIIDALDQLSYPNRKTEKLQSKRNALLNSTAENLGLKPSEVESRAQLVLKEILHRFEDFNVLTIDKFSLRLIRTFAKDLDLQQDFNVILDETLLLEQVVDKILSTIGQKEHEVLTALAMQYAKSNLDEGDKWNFRTSLIEFATVLTKESNAQYIKRILNQDYTKENYKIIKDELKQVETRYQKLKTDYSTFFNSLGLVDTDLPSKSTGLFGFGTKILARTFDKKPIVGKTVLKTLNGEGVKPEHKLSADLVEKTNQFIAAEIDLFDEYYILKTLRKNFYNLALLKYVGEQLEQVKKNENIIRISEFNKMISELISEETAPYIYERLGTKFGHYLLDEFQDTSRLQWLNLIPLIDDSIAQGKENLIVGDPKQAIYRFRNGLVEQFIALPKIYNPEHDNHLALLSQNFDNAGYKHPLEDNWRSCKNIVRFNNLFFPEFAKYLTEEKQEAYTDVKQELKGKDGGYVEVRAYKEKFSSKEFHQEEHLNILNWIRECEADGFNRGDICLLARNKKDGARWAQFLTKQEDNFKIVSADSLAIGADKTIQLFIDYLNLRRNYSNHTKQTQFAVSYFVQQGLDPLVNLKEYWLDEKVGKLDIDKFTTDVFDGKQKLIYNYDNLYDLGQQFSRLFKVDEIKNPYLHHLMEMLQQFDLNDGPDIRGFLEFWNVSGKKETVQVPQNKEAIIIMTAHQSKGLEFPVVILPKLGWKLDQIDNAFIDTKHDLIYTKPSDAAPEFVSEVKDFEKNQILMDEINLLYVSMTRPVQRMYMLAKPNAKNYLESLFVETLDNLSDNNLKVEEKENELKLYTYGKKEKNLEEIAVEEEKFSPKSIQDFLWFPEISLQDKDALEAEDLSVEQRFGNQLHLILSEINSLDQLEKEMSQLQQKDLLEKPMIAKLESEAKKVLSNEIYQTIINESDKILSEQEIILDKTTVRRPDKMFVKGNEITLLDFKTGEKKQKDIAQLRDYAFALKEIGFKEVSGILFYTKNDTVERVL